MSHCTCSNLTEQLPSSLAFDFLKHMLAKMPLIAFLTEIGLMHPEQMRIWSNMCNEGARKPDELWRPLHTQGGILDDKKWKGFGF